RQPTARSRLSNRAEAEAPAMAAARHWAFSFCCDYQISYFSPTISISSQSLAPPEDFPFGQHHTRIVSILIQNHPGPFADSRMRELSPRRAHGPELFIKALAGKHCSPLAPRLALAEPSDQIANKDGQRTEERRRQSQVVKRLFAADLKLPGL